MQKGKNGNGDANMTYTDRQNAYLKKNVAGKKKKTRK